HGWSFDGDGLCRRIPQAATPCPAERQARHLAATSLPVREAVGLLWLWPDPASAALAEATPLPLSPFVDAAEGFRWSSFVRELPYDWRTLIENVADPAHVPFAHHGIQGDRRRAGPIPLQLREQSARRIVAEVSSRAIAMHTTIVFQPPSLLEYRFTFPGNRRMGLITYGLPVAPGRCRLVAQFSRDWSSPWWQWRPRWWDHLFNRNEVLDGDLLMLVEQERELARRGSDGHRADWRQAYRLPTSSDRLVIAFQHWLERHGGPDWEALLAGGAAEASGRQAIVSRQGSAAEPGPSAGSAASGVAEGAAGIGSGQRQSAFRASSIAAAPPASSRQLLDRHQQHTQHCASCRQALAWTRRLQGIGLLLFVLSLAAAALLPDAARLPLGLPLLLLGLVGLAAAAGLRFGLEPWFRYRPYDHTRR
ncbi:MAG: hypothetical protein VKK62_09400, partial [Synechococcaceae cyanobacterium]|nr:hypothetical protein [Synechococcaceae cyanobacterium]